MPAPIELSALIGLPPAEAIAAFEAKGYAISWNWFETWKEAHARAFTVAKLTRIDVLQDIRGAVGEALQRGETEQWFARRLEPVLQDKGWWGKKIVVGSDGGAEVVQEGSPRRLQTIFRTNMQTAYAAGRWKAFDENKADRPYLQYVAVGDSRTRPAHLRLNGKVFPIDSPVWRVIAPPNGFNCRCRLRALTVADLAARGLAVEENARIETRDASGPMPVDKRTGEADPSRRLQRGVSIVDRGIPGGRSRMTLWADPGWDYNPGEAPWQPFTPPPLDTLPRTFPVGVSLPGLPTATPVQASRLLPVGLPPQDYAQAFLAEFGGASGKTVVFEDVKAGALVIDESLFKDGAGNWKADKDERGPYMRLLADAAKDPHEIWLRWEESRDKPGAWLLKRRYIKTFEIDYGNGTDTQYGLTVFEVGKDGWTGSSAMVANAARNPDARRRYIEKQRDGFLLYRK